MTFKKFCFIDNQWVEQTISQLASGRMLTSSLEYLIAINDESYAVKNDTRVAYLSSEMLQSMTVDLLVLTTMNGKRMIDPGSGRPLSRSVLRLRSTRFLNAICCTANIPRQRQ